MKPVHFEYTRPAGLDDAIVPLSNGVDAKGNIRRCAGHIRIVVALLDGAAP